MDHAIFHSQLDVDPEKICNFTLEDNGKEVRVTVWKADLHLLAGLRK